MHSEHLFIEWQTCAYPYFWFWFWFWFYFVFVFILFYFILFLFLALVTDWTRANNPWVWYDLSFLLLPVGTASKALPPLLASHCQCNDSLTACGRYPHNASFSTLLSWILPKGRLYAQSPKPFFTYLQGRTGNVSISFDSHRSIDRHPGVGYFLTKTCVYVSFFGLASSLMNVSMFWNSYRTQNNVILMQSRH